MATVDRTSPIWTIGGFEFQVIIGTNDSGRRYIINQARRVGQANWTLVMEAEIDLAAYRRFDIP